jgi:hypothetical protein
MSPEDCADRRSALAGAAIGRLDEHEMLALQAHLDGCPSCRDELEELRSVAALVALADPQHVAGGALRIEPSGLGDHIVDRVRDARVERADHLTRRRRHSVFVAVAGLAAAIAIAVSVSVRAGSDHTTTARRTVTLRGHDAVAEATLIAAHDGTDVDFHGKVVHDGDRYWLWLTDASGKRMAAATFWDDPDGNFSIRGHGAIPYTAVRRVWVTDQHNDVVLDYKLPAPTATS